MSLIGNLNAINDCKEDIKNALEEKGVVMNGVQFSEYAGKIRALQFESGDEPSTPEPSPSADYIYSNGYLTNGTETNEIINFVPYEIVLDDNSEFIIELTCPEEIPGYEGGYCDIILTVDVPTTYSLSNFEYLDEAFSGDYVPQEFKLNPRYSTIVRNGVKYNSYVRQVSDNNDYGSADVQYEPLKYRITIKK